MKQELINTVSTAKVKVKNVAIVKKACECTKLDASALATENRSAPAIYLKVLVCGLLQEFNNWQSPQIMGYFKWGKGRTLHYLKRHREWHEVDHGYRYDFDWCKTELVLEFEKSIKPVC